VEELEVMGVRRASRTALTAIGGVLDVPSRARACAGEERLSDLEPDAAGPAPRIEFRGWGTLDTPPYYARSGVRARRGTRPS